MGISQEEASHIREHYILDHSVHKFHHIPPRKYMDILVEVVFHIPEHYIPDH